ncbi:uncharacterized protein DS421_13g414130 [Arachis hypogaea]|nr:uncharacterized protein DS421_13g414130 [Arachis hypogaea]
MRERELPSTRRHHRVRGREEEREREEEATAVAVRTPSLLPFVNQTPSPSEALAAAENPITVRSIASPLGGFEGGKEADSITPAVGGGTSCATVPLRRRNSTPPLPSPKTVSEACLLGKL